MKDQTTTLVISLGLTLKQKLKEMRNETVIGGYFTQALLEWFARCFIKNTVPKNLCAELLEIHDKFIRDNYCGLSLIASGYNLQKSEWKKNGDVSFTFYTGQGKVIPSWESVVEIKVPESSDRDATGLLVINPASTDTLHYLTTRMPKHSEVQERSHLSMGIHSNAVLQKAFFENEDNNELDSFFLVFNDHEADSMRWKQDFAHWVTQTRTGSVAIPVGNVMEHGLGTQKEKIQITQKSSVGKKSKHLDLSIAGVVYKSPSRVANDKRIPLNQVFARLHSKSPQWKDWFFIGSSKDPR